MSAALTDADLKDAYQRAQALTESETPQAQKIRQAFHEATPYLREFQHALKAGQLVICAQCAQFTFGHEPSSLGQCARHQVEAWPFAPFACAGFEKRKKA